MKRTKNSLTPTTSDIDAADLRTLLIGIVNQALEDYQKLQHPTNRVKKYLQEDYLTAFDFLFDDEFELAYLPNGTNGNMSVHELLCEVLDTDSPNIEMLRNYAVKTTKEYWEGRKLAVLDHIPDTVCVSGRTFNVHHAYITGYDIDIDENTITLDKENSEENQKNFLQAMLEAILLLQDLEFKRSILKVLAKDLHWVLKVNNCFSYAGVASDEELFKQK
jgi:hypothetical protein